jgi:hypothetical protein
MARRRLLVIAVELLCGCAIIAAGCARHASQATSTSAGATLPGSQSTTAVSSVATSASVADAMLTTTTATATTTTTTTTTPPTTAPKAPSGGSSGTAATNATAGGGSNSSDSIATTTTADDTQSSVTVITIISRELDLTWSPAEAPPDSIKQQISDTLTRLGVHALFPSPAPDVIVDALTGSIWVTRTVPTNHVTALVEVWRAEARQPLMGVSSLESAWAVSPNDDWSEVQVRGESGRYYQNGAGLTFLRWEEGDQTYSATFGDELTLDQAIAWLGSWYILP